jgi:hypothetical protein
VWQDAVNALFPSGYANIGRFPIYLVIFVTAPNCIKNEHLVILPFFNSPFYQLQQGEIAQTFIILGPLQIRCMA